MTRVHRERIGVFGGTFDPVHNGHLRTALELVDALALDELRLVPVHRPPHRNAPVAGAAARRAMLERAVAGCERLRVDARELARDTVSYTIDTLRELRAERGADCALCLIVGEDAFAGLRSWREWERLADVAHLVVVGRPGDPAPVDDALAAWCAQQPASSVDALGASPCGRLLRVQLTQLAISATRIRELLAAGRSPRFLLPDSVLDYIREHGLYAAASRRNEDIR